MARHSRPMLPVFGGISGRIRTTLNIQLSHSRFVLILLYLRDIEAGVEAEKCDYSLLATNFSSFTTSAANLRMPSAVFSVAIALSFSR